MAEKKKDTKKTDAKKISIRAQANTQAKAPVKQEDVYPAINLAQMYGVSEFAFFMIKKAKNIDEGTLITMAAFKQYYNEVVEGR